MLIREIDPTAYSVAVPFPQRQRLIAPPRPHVEAPAVVPNYSGLADLGRRRGRALWRACEMLPAIAGWAALALVIIGSITIPLPLAILIAAFDVFWMYISYSTAIHAYRSYRRMRTWRGIDWVARHRADEQTGAAFAGPDEIHHVVIIPNYKEPIEILRRCVESMAEQANARNIIVVLAMEMREQGAGAKATALQNEFEGRLGGIFATFHPAGLPGEVVGKSSNENWAGRIAKRRLVDEQGMDIGRITVSSCDADTVFHPSYFAALSYKFATDPARYRRFWQSPILLTNNIWETAAPIQVGAMLANVHMLGNLSKPDRCIFPQSTYTLSLQMAHEVDYWDADIIPEDWHMFLKCFYRFSGQVEVEPIYLPTGNDAVKAGGLRRSLVEYYQQKKRHAWGASDIPYAVREVLAHKEMPWPKRLRRAQALTVNHLLWTLNWTILTLGWWLPERLRDLVGVEAHVSFWHDLGSLALLSCVLPYLFAIAIDARIRPPRPNSWGPLRTILAVGMWFTLPVTSFFLNWIPAMSAQTRLALGKRLEYRVTEKA